MSEYNIILYCIPEASAAISVLPGDPYIGWGTLWARKISAAKSKTELGSGLDDGRVVEGGGGLGGGIDAPLDFLDCDFSTDGGLDSKIFESEKTFEEIKDVPEHAAWKTYTLREFFINIIFYSNVLYLELLIYL